MEQRSPSTEKQWAQDLHPSFLRHAHRRIIKLGMRCKRLCNTGWDINLVAILHNDAAVLAGQCGAAGLVEESEKVHHLEQKLDFFLREQRLPSQDELSSIEQLCSSLIELEAHKQSLELEPELPVFTESHSETAQDHETDKLQQISHATAPGPRLKPEPGALLLKLPADRWLNPDPLSKGSGDSIKLEEPAESETETQPTHQNRQGPVLVLCQAHELPQELLKQLQQSDFRLETCEQWEEVLPLVQAVESTAILLPAGLKTNPAKIKEEIQRLSEELKHSVFLMVAGKSKDISERVQAMRMGAKRYFPAGSPPNAVLASIRELMGTSNEETARVLVVDDDASQAKFAQSILEKSGMEARSVTDPMQTLDILEDFSPDLILMDLYMPEINGAELTALIRENERFLGTPIVFLSGEQDEERQFEALQMGGDDFLEKPIKPKHLIAAVKTRIQRSRKMQQRTTAADKSKVTSPENARLALIDQLNAMLDEASLENKAFAYVTLKNRITFKETLGYQYLDSALERLQDLIRKHAPEQCIVARFGEFSFGLLCNQQNRSSLAHVLEKLCSLIGQQNIQPQGTEGTLHPHLATGLAWLEDNPRDAARIIAQAEKAAHRAMDQDVFVHEATRLVKSNTVSKDEQQVLGLIQQSLQDETMQLLFQPLINLNDNTKEQYQSLLRLMTPEQDFIPAARFIPVAEKHGLISQLDRYVISRALDTLSHRTRLNRPIRLFISQSVHTWLETETMDWLKDQLDENRFNSNLMCLEFNAKQLDPERMEKLSSHLAPLRKLGTQISLSRYEHDEEHQLLLNLLKPDYAKLDASCLNEANFITELPEIVDWLHQHKCKVIIPRIEQAMDAANFWTSGVDFLQGNFIQSPDSKLQFDFQGSAF